MNTNDAAPNAEPKPSLAGRLRRRLFGQRRLGPGMALFLVAPVVAELCSGATPAIAYIFFGWFLCLMYGGGAILIREFTLRWGKGWPTILALGIAYGIAEEGIAVRTFFDRTAPALKDFLNYGWAGGANWVWITHLVLYHAIISIAIPIFLVTLAYPARRNEPWVDSRWLKKAAIGYVGIHLFWLVVYQRPVQGGYVVACLAAIAAIVWIARRLPATPALPFAGSPEPAADGPLAPTPKRVAIVGFLATVGVFTFSWGHGLGMPPIGAIVAMLLIAAVAGWWFLRSSRRPGWGDRHRYAVAAGIFFFLPAISPLIELSGARGQLIVGIVTGYLIRRTWRRLRERESIAGAAPATPTPAAGPEPAPRRGRTAKAPAIPA